MERPALRVMSRLLAAGQPAYARETDLELAEQSLAATLKLLEALLESDPHNATFLLQAVQGIASYTYAFVETRMVAARGRDAGQEALQRQRAQRLYRRGLQYGLRLLSQYDPAWEQALTLAPAAFRPLLQRLDPKAVPALFWTAFCWGSLLNLERAALETLAMLPRLQLMLQRLLVLDETFFYGAPHLLLAVFYASRSPLLGGDPQRARQHFARARALSAGRLLLVPLLEAQYYAVQVQDRRLFVTLLRQVLDAPETLLPEQGLLNAVAKRWAALLLQRVDDLFV